MNLWVKALTNAHPRISSSLSRQSAFNCVYYSGKRPESQWYFANFAFFILRDPRLREDLKKPGKELNRTAAG
jgi:hypothetical protein